MPVITVHPLPWIICCKFFCMVYFAWLHFTIQRLPYLKFKTLIFLQLCLGSWQFWSNFVCLHDRRRKVLRSYVPNAWSKMCFTLINTTCVPFLFFEFTSTKSLLKASTVLVCFEMGTQYSKKILTKDENNTPWLS